MLCALAKLNLLILMLSNTMVKTFETPADRLRIDTLRRMLWKEQRLTLKLKARITKIHQQTQTFKKTHMGDCKN